jgi:hypothetical protein
MDMAAPCFRSPSCLREGLGEGLNCFAFGRNLPRPLWLRHARGAPLPGGGRKRLPPSARPMFGAQSRRDEQRGRLAIYIGDVPDAGRVDRIFTRAERNRCRSR